MDLILSREPSGARATLGKLCLGTGGDGAFICDTLEDVVREPAGWQPGDPIMEWKVPGETAIPAGRYRVTITHSAHFGRDLPLLEGVPGFDGVRIHSGNTAADTEGCILTGKRMGPATVVESRKAFLDVYLRIKDELDAGREVWISVRNAA